MKNSILRVGLAAMVTVSAIFGLAACGSDAGSSTSSSSGAAASAEAPAADAGTRADLELARQTILDTLKERGDLPEIYLAPDVKKPESKYGMLVVPYVHSDATEKLTTSIVKIENGKFKIGAISAESGKEYSIDQDGQITEVTK